MSKKKAVEVELSAKDHWVEQIEEAGESASKAERKMDQAKLVAKEAKAIYDNSVVRLRKIISDGPEELPLFDGPKEETEAEKETPEVAGSPRLALPIAEFPEWDKIGKYFAGKNLEVFGDLVRFVSGNNIEELPGVGPATAGMIRAVVDEFAAGAQKEKGAK